MNIQEIQSFLLSESSSKLGNNFKTNLFISEIVKLLTIDNHSTIQ